jgi:hypothetical protein
VERSTSVNRTARTDVRFSRRYVSAAARAREAIREVALESPGDSTTDDA